MRLRKSSSHKAAAQHRRGPGECRNAVLLTHICLSQISSCSVCRLPSALNRTLPIHSFLIPFQDLRALEYTVIISRSLSLELHRKTSHIFKQQNTGYDAEFEAQYVLSNADWTGLNNVYIYGLFLHCTAGSHLSAEPLLLAQSTLRVPFWLTSKGSRAHTFSTLV